MNKETQIRKALKEIQTLSDAMSEGMYMDNAMDGSGECGGIIADGWNRWFQTQVNNVMIHHNLTLTEVIQKCDEWAHKELQMGPKKVFIPVFTKKDGLCKEVDYFDTKYGALRFTISQAQYINNTF